MIGEFTDAKKAQDKLEETEKELKKEEDAKLKAKMPKKNSKTTLPPVNPAVATEKEKKEALYNSARTAYETALEELIAKADADAAATNDKKDGKDAPDKDKKDK